MVPLEQRVGSPKRRRLSSRSAKSCRFGGSQSDKTDLQAPVGAPYALGILSFCLKPGAADETASLRDIEIRRRVEKGTLVCREGGGESIHSGSDGSVKAQEFVFGYWQYVNAIDQLTDARLRPCKNDGDEKAKWLRLRCRRI